VQKNGVETSHGNRNALEKKKTFFIIFIIIIINIIFIITQLVTQHMSIKVNKWFAIADYSHDSQWRKDFLNK